MIIHRRRAQQATKPAPVGNQTRQLANMTSGGNTQNLSYRIIPPIITYDTLETKTSPRNLLLYNDATDLFLSRSVAQSTRKLPELQSRATLLKHAETSALPIRPSAQYLAHAQRNGIHMETRLSCPSHS